jgi:hypothetical protein
MIDVSTIRVFKDPTVIAFSRKTYNTYVALKFKGYFGKVELGNVTTLRHARIQMVCPHHGPLETDARSFAQSKYGCRLCAKTASMPGIEAKRLEKINSYQRLSTTKYASLDDLIKGTSQRVRAGISRRATTACYDDLNAYIFSMRRFGHTETNHPAAPKEDLMQLTLWRSGHIEKPRIPIHSPHYKTYLEELDCRKKLLQRNSVETQRSATHAANQQGLKISHLHRYDPTLPRGMSWTVPDYICRRIIGRDQLS